MTVSFKALLADKTQAVLGDLDMLTLYNNTAHQQQDLIRR